MLIQFSLAHLKYFTTALVVLHLSLHAFIQWSDSVLLLHLEKQWAVGLFYIRRTI